MSVSSEEHRLGQEAKEAAYKMFFLLLCMGGQDLGLFFIKKQMQ